MAATLSPPIAEAKAPASLPLADEALYEIVNGERKELPAMSILSVKIASKLGRRVGNFAEEKKLGEVVNEAIFLLPLETHEQQRRPDVSFVSYNRWAADRPVPDTDPWPVVPDLAVEVISPNDFYREVQAKVREYFQAGVRLVWVVEPSERQVTVYISATKPLILNESDVLDGGDVLPGFQLPVRELFP